MASMEQYVNQVKPALDAFLRAPTKANLISLQDELTAFSWSHMNIFNVQILCPLVMKLEELCFQNPEIQAGIINCITTVTSKIYIKDNNQLRTMLTVVLRQIREFNSTTTKPNLSEEIKLAAVECFSVVLRRSTSDVLELFYTKDTATLGQILLSIVNFIENEKYKKLLINSMECLMVIFYVHDEADSMDVVLRNQVSDALFIYLPKIVTILFKTSVSDEKLGETLKATTIKALGRVLCVNYESTNEAIVQSIYNSREFKKLFNSMMHRISEPMICDDDIVLGIKKSKDQLVERLERVQCDGRSSQWFAATSRKLKIIFIKISILRSHQSTRIRLEYAQLCCLLMERCAENLRDNFIHLLESVLAMSEDTDANVRRLCQSSLQKLQAGHGSACIFDENAERLFNEHLTKLPRIINRSDDAEQYAELTFLKGFLQNLSVNRLQLLLTIPKNLEMFSMCLLSAVDLCVTRDLLQEEYSLREMNDNDSVESNKLHWRQFRNVHSIRSIKTLQEIFAILGKTKLVNHLLFDYFLELMHHPNVAINEVLLSLVWMACVRDVEKKERLVLVELLLEEILKEHHWQLALQPDLQLRLEVQKQSDWFVDGTPGLYESAIEMRTQDFDSDDEDNINSVDRKNRVSIADAQFNVLHTCIVLDALGHCASFQGDLFDKYLFRSLHKVLLKISSNNSMIYQAAQFSLISMQKALKFAEISHFIETYTDYITYHLNTTLKRTPESQSAVDILTVVLQFSTRNALPHFESIFQTVRDECAKACQTENIVSYLKVFNAFLTHVAQWQINCNTEVNSVSSMQIDGEQDMPDILAAWLKASENTTFVDEDITFDGSADIKQPNEASNTTMTEKGDEKDIEEQNCDTKPTLPRHIGMIKDILYQVLKFISSAERLHQILALECLIKGLPLISDYENELLPLVHLIWQPLLEKFRQKEAIVLNRCFSLLNILAKYAKEFILKRSLDDVIPFLKQFLKEAANRSANQIITAQTQEYKLQLKLLHDFSNLIQSMQIDGKHLNEILEVVSLYLSQEQPKELQDIAILFYSSLRYFNGPLVYLVVLKKSHLKDYNENTSQILKYFNMQ